MRVLAISHNFPHEEDSTCGVFVARQMKEMSQQGAKIVLMVPIVYAPQWIHRIERYRDFGPTRKLLFDNSIQAYVQPFLRMPGRFFLPWDGKLAYWAARQKVKRLHQNCPFDLIFGRGFWLESDLASRLGRLLKVPSVGVGIGSDVNVTPHYGKRYFKHFLQVSKNLDYLLATGQGVADKIGEVSGKKVPVIGGLVDLESFCPKENKEQIRNELRLGKGCIILFVGHLKKAKGIYELVEAFCQLLSSHDNVRLIICGNGAEEKALLEVIRSIGIDQKVTVTAGIAPDHMNKWMQASDLFVLPSYHEGMPNAVMEAMACGLPVVTTAVGGLPSAIGDCEGAVLVPPGSIPELRDAMKRIVSDRDLRLKMSKASRKRAEERFDIKTNTTRLLKLFQEFINSYSLISSSSCITTQ